jgi:hypothetical protein
MRTYSAPVAEEEPGLVRDRVYVVVSYWLTTRGRPSKVGLFVVQGAFVNEFDAQQCLYEELAQQARFDALEGNRSARHALTLALSVAQGLEVACLRARRLSFFIGWCGERGIRLPPHLTA